MSIATDDDMLDYMEVMHSRSTPIVNEIDVTLNEQSNKPLEVTTTTNEDTTKPTVHVLTDYLP